MDNNTNDHDPEVPPGVSPEELEEALKWLEELAGRSTAQPEAALPPAMAADASPFRDLIENDEGHLPDWLHEGAATPAEAPLTEDGDYESRLDWLAKMAERESIEELPTVEWRRISDPAQMAAVEAGQGEPPAGDAELLPPGQPGEALPVGETPEQPLAAEAVFHLPETAEEMPPEAAAEAPALAAAAGAPALAAAAEAPALAAAAEGEPSLEALALDEATPPAPDLAAAPISPETLLDSLPPDVELPPIDDLDATMAWIEEMAVSQETPIEDVPSVADRALASKLLMEAGLSPDALELAGRGDELALGDLSLLEGNTPVNAFVAAEDFADTIVLAETIAADQGRTLEEPPPAAPPPPAEAPAPEDTAFVAAMSFLDDLAAAQEPDAATTQPITPVELETEVEQEGPVAFAEEAMGLAEAEEMERPEWLEALTPEPEAGMEIGMEADEQLPPAIEEIASLEAAVAAPWDEAAPADIPAPPEDALAGGEAAWLETTPAAEVAAPTAPGRANGDRATTLDEALRAVDALALPPGTSLADVDASLRGSGLAPARRDLPGAVEWLEVALGISVPTPAVAPSDEDLLAHMPEDPDAVLAWLEQMAEEDTVGSSPSLTAEEALPAATDAAPPASAPAAEGAAAPPLDELSEADLLSMPDDPDAVIAWLEGLAGGATLAGQPAPATPAAPPPPVADWPPAEQPGDEEAALGLAEEPATGAPGEETSAPAWTAGAAGAAEAAEAETGGAEGLPGEWAAMEAAPSAAPPAADTEPAVTTTGGGHGVPAQPRRRSRRQRTATAEATAGPGPLDEEGAAAPQPAEETTTAATPTPDAAEAPAPPETPAAEPPPPPKPASWVDLLKPLR